MRPALDSRWPQELRTLMESCWNAEPDHRPDAAQAVKTLCRVIDKIDADDSRVTFTSL